MDAPLRRRRFAVCGGEDHGVPVRVGDPQLAVLRVRVEVDVEDDARSEVASARDGCVEVVDLEPQHHAVADWRFGVAQVTVVVVSVPCVKLEDESVRSPRRVMQARVIEALVLTRPIAVVSASVASEPAAEQPPVEAARRLDVANHDQRLGPHLVQDTSSDALLNRRGPSRGVDVGCVCRVRGLRRLQVASSAGAR